MAIDIGAGAANYDSTAGTTYTCIDLTNPANADGTIDTIEIWQYAAGTGVKAGTLSGSGTSYTSRDFETLGNVTSGSKQTFTGLSCDVRTGDFAGWYSASGNLEANTTGGSGVYYAAGDKFGAGATEYTLSAQITRLAVYGTGSEATALPIFAYHYNNMRP